MRGEKKGEREREFWGDWTIRQEQNGEMNPRNGKRAGFMSMIMLDSGCLDGHACRAAFVHGIGRAVPVHPEHKGALCNALLTTGISP